jgi:hypothetical protein
MPALRLPGLLLWIIFLGFSFVSHDLLLLIRYAERHVSR